MKRPFILLLSILSCVVQAQNRQETDLRTWQFSRDSVHWQPVTVPHDWAISGPFDKKWDLQCVAITQNGEQKATEKSGRSGALPWIGKGFYQTELTFETLPSHAWLAFDGAMAEPKVYVNGHFAGEWKYGYTPFRIDATRWLKKGRNLIAVTLNNVEESSRWYPGAGLYRPVKLVTTGETHFDSWATFVRTERIEAGKAILKVDFQTVGPMKGRLVRGRIVDDRGNLVASFSRPAAPTGLNELTVTVKKPHCWSPETPRLYTLDLAICRERGSKGPTLVDDRQQQRFGIRTVSVSKAGFKLNGVARKIKGVCLHHDLGPLGAAVNKAALIRQIRLLKDMGCDAIRTSHNIPSTLQMEVCDSMGMMVMAESFDMWRYPKCKNGYARFFQAWSERDIENLVRCHRNHPSIIMWSIGNEIPEQGSAEGREMARNLQAICHRLDPTRPVTQGMDRAEAALKSGFAQEMDVPGFNYRVYKYDTNITQLPAGFLLGAETASTVSSRGVYKFPARITDKATYSDGQCSSYDTEYCGWSNLPEADFLMQEDRPWTIGQFVWTGFDYLGEPTPYDEFWPSRSSYFGIFDLAGIPKDRYYLYRSQWNKRAHTLHLLPHWTWNGREGMETPVFVYTDYPCAELFLNGKSLGRKCKQAYTVAPGTPNEEKRRLETKELLQRYRLMWDDVKYEPGELKVIAYDASGKAVATQQITTAGLPDHLVLEADRNSIHADGDDLCFVTVSLVDAKGTLIPTADNALSFDVSGAATFKAACNGDATSLEPFTEPRMKLFNGKLVVIVQSNRQRGDITLTVTDKSLGKHTTLKLKAD